MESDEISNRLNSPYRPLGELALLEVSLVQRRLQVLRDQDPVSMPLARPTGRLNQFFRLVVYFRVEPQIRHVVSCEEVFNLVKCRGPAIADNSNAFKWWRIGAYGQRSTGRKRTTRSARMRHTPKKNPKLPAILG